MPFDVAIQETGNGGDIVLTGNDFLIVNGIENMPYLASYGGNKEASTESKTTAIQSKDYWANSLLMRDNASIQFNSVLESIANKTDLDSSGRITLENAFKKDLAFFKAMGYTVKVTVYITATNRFEAIIKLTTELGSGRTITVKYRKLADGDFSMTDFNEDFF